MTAVRPTRAFALALALAAMAGCAGQGVGLQSVKVPLAIVCQETVPTRPVMPTEGLHPPVALDAFVAAAAAEIERREGYELELMSALEACRAPISALAGTGSGGIGLKAWAGGFWRKAGF